MCDPLETEESGDHWSLIATHSTLQDASMMYLVFPAAISTHQSLTVDCKLDTDCS